MYFISRYSEYDKLGPKKLCQEEMKKYKKNILNILKLFYEKYNKDHNLKCLFEYGYEKYIFLYKIVGFMLCIFI